MDSLLKAGQSFLQSQGGNNDNNNGGQQQQQHQGGGSGGFDLGSLAGLVQHAQNNDQNNSGSSDLFSQAAKFLQNSNAGQDGNVDEQQLMQSHEKVNQGGEAHSNEIGQAAALGAIKQILGGSGGGQTDNGGGFQQKIIGAAMAQAAQLFDQKQANGQVTGGDKQSAVNQAAEAAMKLMVKHQVSGMIGGGQSGGLGSLAKLLM
ncbi:unnamed protein product [Parajaminaea phylloscopi]